LFIANGAAAATQMAAPMIAAMGFENLFIRLVLFC
jgi:hypothetical protein